MTQVIGITHEQARAIEDRLAYIAGHSRVFDDRHRDLYSRLREFGVAPPLAGKDAIRTALSDLRPAGTGCVVWAETVEYDRIAEDGESVVVWSTYLPQRLREYQAWCAELRS